MNLKVGRRVLGGTHAVLNTIGKTKQNDRHIVHLSGSSIMLIVI